MGQFLKYINTNLANPIFLFLGVTLYQWGAGQEHLQPNMPSDLTVITEIKSQKVKREDTEYHSSLVQQTADENIDNIDSVQLHSTNKAASDKEKADKSVDNYPTDSQKDNYSLTEDTDGAHEEKEEAHMKMESAIIDEVLLQEHQHAEEVQEFEGVHDAEEVQQLEGVQEAEVVQELEGVQQAEEVQQALEVQQAEEVQLLEMAEEVNQPEGVHQAEEVHHFEGVQQDEEVPQLEELQHSEEV